MEFIALHLWITLTNIFLAAFAGIDRKSHDHGGRRYGGDWQNNRAISRFISQPRE
jgi:hypothetical protein